MDRQSAQAGANYKSTRGHFALVVSAMRICAQWLSGWGFKSWVGWLDGTSPLWPYGLDQV